MIILILKYRHVQIQYKQQYYINFITVNSFMSFSSVRDAAWNRDLPAIHVLRDYHLTSKSRPEINEHISSSRKNNVFISWGNLHASQLHHICELQCFQPQTSHGPDWYDNLWKYAIIRLLNLNDCKCQQI